MSIAGSRVALRTALIVLLFAVSTASAQASGFPPPPPDELGPYAVGRISFDAVDESRGGRSLPVDVWYPVDADDAVGVPPSVYDLVFTGIASAVALDGPPVSDAGPFPLVVFSHGNNGIRFQSYFLMETLASHGFVVAAPDHVGNTAIDLLIPGIPFDTRDRPLDISFVIDQMLARNADPADALHASFLPQRIGVGGHSFGGFTTLAMAAGFEDLLPDPRVRVLLPISPASNSFTDAQLTSIDEVTLFLSGTLDTIVPVDPGTTRPFELLSSRPRWRVDVVDAGHNSFTNICDFVDALEGLLPPELLAFLLGNADQGCGPDLIAVEEAQRLTNLYAVAFLRTKLAYDFRYLPYLTPFFAQTEPDIDFYYVPLFSCGLGAELAFVLPALLCFRRPRRG